MDLKRAKRQNHHALPGVLRALALALATCAVLGAEAYRFELGGTQRSPDELPRSEAIGVLRVGPSLRLPAYQLTILDSASDTGFTTCKPDSMHAKADLDPKAAGRLAAYAHPEGWILVPRGWKPLGAAAGMDGSGYVSFVPPQGLGHITYDTAGGCAGCAAMDARPYFPEVRRRPDLADQPYPGTNVPLKVFRISRTLAAYRAWVRKQPIDGLACFAPDSDSPFYRVEVSLPAGDRDLAGPILDWFLNARQRQARVPWRGGN
jgi:hypothetical protein